MPLVKSIFTKYKKMLYRINFNFLVGLLRDYKISIKFLFEPFIILIREGSDNVKVKCRTNVPIKFVASIDESVFLFQIHTQELMRVLILILRIYSWSYHSWMVVFEWHPTEKLAQIQIFERNPWLPKRRSFNRILSINIWYSFIIILVLKVLY